MQTATQGRDVSAPVRRWRLRWPSRGLHWFAFDLLVPTALLYLLLWQGAGLYIALLGSASLSAITSLISYRRGSGDQRVAPFMLAMAIAGFGIALITGSDRFLLAKESVLTVMAGGWFLISMRADRPLTYRFTRPLLEGRMRRTGPPWEQLWEREPEFQRIWRMSSLFWAIALFIDAIARVVMAYTLPVNAVPALQTTLMIVTMLVMQVVTWVYYWRTGLWAMVHRPYRDA